MSGWAKDPGATEWLCEDAVACEHSALLLRDPSLPAGIRIFLALDDVFHRRGKGSVTHLEFQVQNYAMGTTLEVGRGLQVWSNRPSLPLIHHVLFLAIILRLCNDLGVEKFF